jgi:hypothetical protein
LPWAGERSSEPYEWHTPNEECANTVDNGHNAAATPNSIRFPSVMPRLGPLGPPAGYRVHDIIPDNLRRGRSLFIVIIIKVKQTAYDHNLVIDLLLLPSARQPSKPHHRTKLQAILLPNHALVLLPKLTCQFFAPCYVLRTDKINCHFDRICQIGNLKHNHGQLLYHPIVPLKTDLMCTSRRDEHRIPRTLIYTMTLDPIVVI